MFKYLIAFVLLTPLIGIWLVEGGEYAGSIGTDGYPNGATVAFAVYAAGVVLIAWAIAAMGRKPAQVTVSTAGANVAFRRFSYNLLFFEVAFLLVFLFGFGAINVWLGGVTKGEFRTSLGAFGAIPNLTSKFIVPGLLAYSTILYRRTTRGAGLRLLWIVNLTIAFLIGASWGFKMTAMSAVLPALLLYYWRIRPFALFMMGLAFAGTLVVFFLLFDAAVENGADLQVFLLRRLTVLQGDVAWYVWDMHVSGQTFPNYWPTLLAAVSDKMLVVLGLERSNLYEWMLYHYDWMLTYIAGVPLDLIEGGQSFTATPFAEGLVAGGIAGLIGVTVIAGVLTGAMYRFIDNALRRGRDVGAMLGVTYFFYYVFPWLNSGAIVQLFHISLVVSISGTLLALYVMRRVRFLKLSVPPRSRAADKETPESRLAPV